MTDLPDADSAYYGFWGTSDFERREFELRFYSSNDKAKTSGTFFAEEATKEIVYNGTKNLGPFSNFIRDLSKDFPIQYGIISIIFAILLGVSAAFIRRFFSDLRKKHFKKA